MSIEDRLPDIMKEIAGVPRFCETPLPNYQCPYTTIGCYGCSNKAHPEVQKRLEEERCTNRIYGLPQDADGIDRRAYLAGSTRQQAEERFGLDNRNNVRLRLMTLQHFC